MQLIQHIKVVIRSNHPGITNVFHARLFGRFIEINFNLGRKKLHRANQGLNFLRDSFGNRYNIRTPTQFRRERQFQYLKRKIFIMDRPIHIHNGSTTVFRSFSNETS